MERLGICKMPQTALTIFGHVTHNRMLNLEDRTRMGDSTDNISGIYLSGLYTFSTQ